MSLILGFSTVKSDQLICKTRCLFGGIIVNASTDGGDVAVYNGNDAGSGDLFHTFQGLANESLPILLPNPVLFERGLFVDVGSNITNVTILWLPMPLVSE